MPNRLSDVNATPLPVLSAARWPPNLGRHLHAGHHADVGGITPGSMPPTSRTLVEEGATIVSFKLVRGGAFQVRLFRV